MAARSPVGVDNDLASGEPGVPLGPADFETARRVDEHARIDSVELETVEHRSDHEFLDLGAQHLRAHPRRVLGREHHGIDRTRHDPVVAHCHLGLSVGAEVIDHAGLANLGESLRQSMGDPDWHGHVLRRLGGRIAEHDSLVARTLPVEVVDTRLLTAFKSVINPLSDIRRLATD